MPRLVTGPFGNGECDDYVVGLDTNGRSVDSATEISNFIGFLKDGDKNQKRAYQLEAKELAAKTGKTAHETGGCHTKANKNFK